MAISKKNRDNTKLNIIVPVFNEEKSFPKTYAAIKKHVKTPFVVTAVYDFDEDTTVPVVRKLKKNDRRLKLLKNTLGRGPLNALKVGFASVKSGPILVVMADLSDDLNDVDKMVELYQEGNDIVAGSRYVKGGKQLGGPLLKRTMSRIAGVSLYYLRRLPTHDVTNNFKLYNSRKLNNIEIESTQGFSIAMEITVKIFLAGGKIAEVPTTWKDRTEGEANFKLWSWLPQYMRWYLYAFRPKGKIK
ncbi:MAG TPA: glycosyltransferase [Patescibacteria group bacterium]|nr:glycosyltransferase [Patescibacteria group bacterium]